MMTRLFLFLLLTSTLGVTLCPLIAPAQSSAPATKPQIKTKTAQTSKDAIDIKKMLTEMDALYRSSASKGTMAMTIETPDWSRTIEMAIWTKGDKYTLIRIAKPRKDKGVSFLKRDQNIWNFFPKINKVIKVPPSMMMASWMGSDFTNDDLAKDSSLIKDYKATKTQENAKQVTFALVPSSDAKSLWGKILITLDKATKLPMHQEFYDERGEKIRTMRFNDVKKLGSRKLPTTLELIPHSKKGYRTTIRYVDMAFDAKIPDNVFTLRNLQSRR